MLNKKIILIAILLISLLSLSAVSAAEDATSDIATASDDAVIEESISDEVSNVEVPDEEPALEESDENVLSNGSEIDPPLEVRSFTNLNEDINNGNDIVTLNCDYEYRELTDDEDLKEGILITRSVTIDGQGHTIYGNNQARMFYVAADNVVIKNLNFINGFSDTHGGAIFWGYCNHGNVSNCTFVNNYADSWGGAIYWSYRTDNIAYNCTFDGNSAGDKGGAVLSLEWVGATVENCIAKTSSDTQFNMICIAPTLTVNYGQSTFSGDNLTFDLKTNGGDTITKGKIIIEIYEGEQLIDTYDCLSDEGWIVNLPAGSYNAVFKTEYIGGNQVNINLIVEPGISFTDLNNAINGNNNNVITLTHNYKYIDDMDSAFKYGIAIDRTLTINGNGYIIDGSNIARIFYVNARDVVFNNIKFICGFTNGNGAAIYGDDDVTTLVKDSYFSLNTANYGGALDYVNAINCSFIENNATKGGAIHNGAATDCAFILNTASEEGGAIYQGVATNCNFTQNTANYGGAISICEASNCNFTDNKAEYGSGGAIFAGNAINCIFTNNYADGDGGAICDGNATDCTFTKNTGYYGNGGAIYGGNAINCNFSDQYTDGNGGAIYNGDATDCTFTNNRAYGSGGAIYNGGASNCIFSDNTAMNHGGAICYGEATNCNFTQNTANYGGAINNGVATNCNFTQNTAYVSGGAINDGTANNCTFILNTAPEGVDTYDSTVDTNCESIIPTFSASDFSTSYNYGEKFIFKLATPDQIFDGVNTLLSISKNGAVVNYTAPSGSGWTVNLAPGTYIVELSIPDSNIASLTRIITVAKNPAKITASAVTATYNVNKYLVIKLTDGKGKALSGVNVTVTLGTTKVYTTDTKGQIKINVATLVPKTYTAKIKYAGNAYYVAASKSVKVVVKKATPKMTAKAKTFKVKVKTKKYTITLKTNKNKVMKKVKVTLKVNKKTFKATTNSKGVATFKITNLKKKGKYTATIKYAGNKYYKALSKKAKITVKK